MNKGDDPTDEIRHLQIWWRLQPDIKEYNDWLEWGLDDTERETENK